MTKVAFPIVPIGEWTPTRPHTAPGLFAYRHLQADGLLHFPDMGGGDMSAEERRDALLRMVNLHRPLAAIVLFLNVVALEDFIRDLGARLAEVPTLDAHFPRISELRPRLVQNPRPFARLDRDPAPLSNWPEVNALYERALGVGPLPAAELPRLHDLALVRHIVAHHAGLVRPIDVQRFQYWDVAANVQLNPPVEFVRELTRALYGIGRAYENCVRTRVFSVVLKATAPGWREQPSELLMTLIELFNFFGQFLADNAAPLDPTLPEFTDRARERGDQNRRALTQLCLDELVEGRAV